MYIERGEGKKSKSKVLSVAEERQLGKGLYNPEGGHGKPWTKVVRLATEPDEGHDFFYTSGERSWERFSEETKWTVCFGRMSLDDFEGQRYIWVMLIWQWRLSFVGNLPKDSTYTRIRTWTHVPGTPSLGSPGGKVGRKTPVVRYLTDTSSKQSMCERESLFYFLYLFSLFIPLFPSSFWKKLVICSLF